MPSPGEAMMMKIKTGSIDFIPHHGECRREAGRDD